MANLILYRTKNMNTLSTSLLYNKILNWSLLKEFTDKLSSKEVEFPCNFFGFQGGLQSFYIADYVQRSGKDAVIVVPTEKEVTEIQTDLSVIAPFLEVNVFPWFGTVPYRAVAKGSVVFGERAAVLAKLCSKTKKGRVFFLLFITTASVINPISIVEIIIGVLFIVCVGWFVFNTTLSPFSLMLATV